MQFFNISPQAVFLAVSDCSNGQEICNDGAEFWPHPDCKFYYHCSGGVPVLRECPPTLYGNQNLVVCDHPLNVPECVGGTRPPPSTTTTRPTTTTEAPHHQIIRIRRPSTNTVINNMMKAGRDKATYTFKNNYYNT